MSNIVWATGEQPEPFNPSDLEDIVLPEVVTGAQAPVTREDFLAASRRGAELFDREDSA